MMDIVERLRRDAEDERSYTRESLLLAADEIERLRTVPPVDGETSDGHHTFAELYEHRSVLFVALMRQHPDISWWSLEHEDGSMFDGYFIAGISTPEGDITYHMKIEFTRFLLPTMYVEQAPPWDGHTPEDVVRRLKRWLACS